MNANIIPFQNVEVIQFDTDGNIIRQSKSHNLIVSTGLDLMRDHLLSSVSAPTPDHFQLGSGTAPVASTDEDLIASNFSTAIESKVLSAGAVEFRTEISYTTGYGLTWGEIGLFTSSSQLIGRTLISPMVKSSVNLTKEYIYWKFAFTPNAT